MQDVNSIPLSKLLWDELENALMIKSRELIKDIARTLKQDEKLLLQAFREKKTKIHLVEMEDENEDHKCKGLDSHTYVAQKCRKPTLLGKSYCPEHELFTMTAEMKKKPQLLRIQNEELEEPFFLDASTNILYNVNYEKIGFLEDGKCVLIEYT
jgi:hypothetical protein